MLQFTQNFIAVIPLDGEEKSPGGVYIPQTAEQRTRKGKVYKVGPGRYENGKLIKTTLEKDQIVYFNKFAGEELNYGGLKLLIFRESEVFAFEKE